jgi:hypothetical protein
MKVKKAISLLAIPVSIGLIFSAQIVHAERTSGNTQPIFLQADSLKGIKYTAQDSTKWSKDKSTVSLYGKATFSCGKFDLRADEIVFNKSSQKVSAKGFTIYNKQTKKTTTGVSGEFDVKWIKS